MELHPRMTPLASGLALPAYPLPDPGWREERASGWPARVAPRRTGSSAGPAVLVTALEAERKRIALELHDGVGQSLTLIKLNAQNSSQLLESGAAKEAQELLQSLLLRVNEALREVRRACSDLWPSMLDDLGLLPTLSCVLRELAVSCPGLWVDQRIEVRECDVPKRLHAPIYRILQEATHNVVKHAAATRLAVRLRRDRNAITLVICDDGRGFDAAARGQAGLGLASMRQRACMSEGKYVLRSRPGRGTRISVSWPVAGAGSGE